MSYVATVQVGIDFGTCNLKASYIKNGKPRILRLSTDQNNMYAQIPNIILYNKKSSGGIENIIGQNAAKNPDKMNKVRYIKKKLQEEKWSKYINNLGREVSADEVVKDIFTVLNKNIKDKVCRNKNDASITLTVPVCFTETQKRRISEAARDAGMNVKAIISEPFAATFSQENLFEDDGEKLVMVFDFGGATLDVSLVNVIVDDGDITVEEKASCGLLYGGTDVDVAIFDQIIKKKYAEELVYIKQQDPFYLDDLMDTILYMKETLYSEEDEEEVSKTYTVRNSAKHIKLSFTRDDVDRVLSEINIKDRIVEMLDDMFDQQDDVSKSDVQDIRIFGGTSHITYFQKMLSDYFGKEVFDAENFLEKIDDMDRDNDLRTAVAAGAARYTTEKEQGNITIINRVPFHIGIKIGIKEKERFKRLIDRNREWGNTYANWEIIDSSQLLNDKYKIYVYQAFSNFPYEASFDSDDGIVFMDTIQLTESLYDKKEPVFLKVHINREGQLEFKFAQNKKSSEDNELVDIELHRINLGS